MIVFWWDKRKVSDVREKPLTKGENKVATKTATKNYYENLNGGVYCYQHLGCSAQGAVDNNPAVRAFDTDMTRWFRMTGKQVAEFTELVKDFGNGEICESCRYEGTK